MNHLAMTEPISFLDVPGLPTIMSFHVDGIDTPDGRNYTKMFTKGITAASWSSLSQALSLTLDNPASSLTTLSAATGVSMPQRVTVGGAAVAAAASQAEFDAATTSTWYYNSSSQTLVVKATQGSGATPVVVDFAGTGDIQPPSTPTNVTASAVSSTRVDVSWTAVNQ